MKGVYRADAKTHIFVSSDIVPDDYVLKANESFENPTGKVSPAKLQGAGWVDATSEEHEAYLKQQEEEFLAQHPTQAPQPDKGDQALNVLGQQIAKMQQQQTTMQQQQATLMQSVNALGQMVAKVAMPSATQPEAPAQPADSQSAAPAQADSAEQK